MARKKRKVPDKLEQSVSLNWSDADLIFDLLKAARPRHPVLGRLQQIMDQLEDAAEQGRELLKRAKASGYFEDELSNIKPLLGEMIKQRKSKLREYAKEVAASNPTTVARMVKRAKKLKGGIG